MPDDDLSRLKTTPEMESINLLSIKPPAFMENSAEAWFAIMEAQFALRKVTTSETKYFYILSSLPPETVIRLPSTLLVQKDYDVLKKTVIDLYESSKPELFEKLISSTVMTGKPSLFLEEISRLANKVGVTEELVKHKFVQSLPGSISPVIAAQQDLNLQQLGKLADELMPLAHKCLAVEAIHQPSPSTTTYTKNPSATRESRTSSPTHMHDSVRPFHRDQRPVICRGHLYFGSKSRFCKPWCRWPNKNKDSLQIQPSSRSSSPAPKSTEN